MLKMFAILDIIIILLILLAFYTQLIRPLWKGTQLFPWFNKKRRAILEEMTETNEQAEQEQLEEYIKRQQSRFKRKRNK